MSVTVNAAANQNPVTQSDSTSTFPGTAVHVNVSSNDSDPDGDSLTVSAFTQGAHGTVSCLPNGDCTYTPDVSFSGPDSFTYTVSDGHGGQAVGTVNVSVDAGDKTVDAPPVKGGVPTNVSRATAFLYTGPNPIQTGVAPNAFEEKRIAVLRGKVTTRDGNVLPGVTVSIVDHPEFGQTTTRVQRILRHGGQRRRPADDSLLGGRLPAGAEAGECAVAGLRRGPHGRADTAGSASHDDLSERAGRAGASGQHDDRQRRQSPHHHPVPRRDDGNDDAARRFAQPLTTMHVRATEYTVGPNGPVAMPANLPGLSGYTYCVELSVDEAIAAGAVAVVFSQPVVTYVENFLKFPVGTDVPVGIYDRAKAAWVPSANGRIVKIVSVTGGAADVDTDGDGVADSGVGITADERNALAAAYPVGQALWRVAVAPFFARGQQLAVFDSDRCHLARATTARDPIRTSRCRIRSAAAAASSSAKTRCSGNRCRSSGRPTA